MDLLEDAWQWDAIRYLAIANLVAGVVVLGELLVGARVPVLVATYGIQTAFALALAVIAFDGERYDVRTFDCITYRDGNRRAISHWRHSGGPEATGASST